MTTAGQIAAGALEMIQVKDPSQDIDATDLATALSELNDMMLEWHEEGVWLGYATVSESSDEFTAPDWSAGPVKANLALRLCPHFGKEAGVLLFDRADKGFRLVKSKTTSFGEYRRPSTMPRGSGNLGRNVAHRDETYPNDWSDDLLSGAGDALADETGTGLDVNPDTFTEA